MGDRSAGAKVATLVPVAALSAPTAPPPQARSRSLIRQVALWASLVLHAGAAAMMLTARPEALVAGGAVVQVTLVGNDVLDLAAGGRALGPASVAPVERATPTVPVAPAAPAQPTSPVPEAAAPVAAARAVTPPTPVLTPVTTAAAPSPVTATAAATDPQALLPLSPVDARATDAAPVALAAPAPAAAVLPETPPPEALQPVPDQPAEAWAEAVRPQRRPAETARTAPTADSPAPPSEKRQTARAAPAPSVPPGNSDRDAKRGSADGAETGAAPGTAKAGASDNASGNAAVSNYPGLVLRKIERTRRAKGAGRGTAVVSFSVAASGGLASVSVIRSSGNARLDDMAADHIRRAAPFPPPPAGAQREFRFEFVGR